MEQPKKPKHSEKNVFLRYLTFGTELGLMLFVAVWGGHKLDSKLNWKMPLCVWVFPLLVLVATFIKLLKDTSEKKEKNE